jgi:hypothetical protein
MSEAIGSELILSDSARNRGDMSQPGLELMDGLNVQFGAGWKAAPGWLNFDGSPSVRIERFPVFGRFFKINATRFPEEVLYGDIIRGLPVERSSAKAVYASHVLEHLAYNDCRTALTNTYDMLVPGGTFRLVVPDLLARTNHYAAAVASGTSTAADDFCRSTLLGICDRPKGLVAAIRDILGNSRHLWMYDEGSMRNALSDAGFVQIRRCRFGDAEDPDFRLVEDESRFVDPHSKIIELALEAKRPR